MVEGSGSVQIRTDPDPDPGGPKIYRTDHPDPQRDNTVPYGTSFYRIHLKQNLST
jgi:hypothetical protein